MNQFAKDLVEFFSRVWLVAFLSAIWLMLMPTWDSSTLAMNVFTYVLCVLFLAWSVWGFFANRRAVMLAGLIELPEYAFGHRPVCKVNGAPMIVVSMTHTREVNAMTEVYVALVPEAEYKLLHKVGLGGRMA